MQCFRSKMQPIRVRITRPNTRATSKPGDARASTTASCRIAGAHPSNTSPTFVIATIAVAPKDLASPRATESVPMARDLAAHRMLVTGAVRVGGTDRIARRHPRRKRVCAREEMGRFLQLKPQCVQ